MSDATGTTDGPRYFWDWPIPIIHVNLALLPVLMAAAALGLLASSLLGLTSQDAQQACYGVGIVVVGALAERWNLRGRALWLPAWFWGFVLLSVSLFSLGGWWIAGGVGTSLIGLVAGSVAVAEKDSRREWAEAPGALRRAKDAALLDDETLFWAEAQKALFVPTGGYGPSVCAHDLAVLGLVKPRLPPSITAEQRARIDLFEGHLRLGVGAAKPLSIAGELSEAAREALASAKAAAKPPTPILTEPAGPKA